jgi:hypothetical protein
MSAHTLVDLHSGSETEKPDRDASRGSLLAVLQRDGEVNDKNNDNGLAGYGLDQERQVPAGALASEPVAIAPNSAADLAPVLSRNEGYVEPGFKGWLNLSGVVVVNGICCECFSSSTQETRAVLILTDGMIATVSMDKGVPRRDS